MRRGWVWPIMRARSPGLALSLPRPSASAILGNCVVLPEPVSPQTMMTWCWSMAAMISTRRAETGRPSGKSIWRGVSDKARTSVKINARTAWDYPSPQH